MSREGTEGGIEFSQSSRQTSDRGPSRAVEPAFETLENWWKVWKPAVQS